MATSWYLKLKRTILRAIIKYNQAGIRYDEPGVTYGGQMPQTTWTYKNKN